MSEVIFLNDMVSTTPISVKFKTNPNNIVAIQIANLSQFQLIVEGLPGLGQIVHTQWKEDVYYKTDEMSYNGKLNIIPQFLTIPNPYFNVFTNIIITAYVYGEPVPTGYPIIHTGYIEYDNALHYHVPCDTSVLVDAAAAAHTAVSLLPNPFVSNQTATASATVYLTGMYVQYGTPAIAATGTGDIVISNLAVANIRIKSKQWTTQQSIYELPIQGHPIPAVGPNQPINIDFPAIVSGGGYTAAIWGYTRIAPPQLA